MRSILIIVSVVLTLNSFGQTDSILSHYFRIGMWGSSESPSNVAPLSDHSFITTGGFDDDVDVEPGPGTTLFYNYGHTDSFIARYIDEDSLIWAFSIGGTYDDHCLDLDVDDNDNFYVVGRFSDINAEFNPLGSSYTLSSPHESGFLAKYDSTGHIHWAFELEVDGFSMVTDEVHVDNSNNVIIGGPLIDTIDLNPLGAPHYVHSGAMIGSGEANSYVAKYDPNGNIIWGYALGDTSTARISDITSDAFGNVYIVGRYTDSIDIDPTPTTFHLPQQTNASTYILKLDPAGNFVWAKSFNGGTAIGATNNVWDIEYGNGHIYIGGTFSVKMDADPGPGVMNLISAPFWPDTYLVKLDLNGDFAWAFNINKTEIDPELVKLQWDYHNSNIILLTHPFYATSDFDPSPITTYYVDHVGAEQDIVFASYAEDMALNWAWRIGCDNWDWGNDFAITPDGKMLVAGAYYTNVDLEPGAGTTYLNLTGGFGGDGYIACYNLNCSDATNYDTLQACIGDSLFLEGAWQTVNGTYYDTLNTLLGCEWVTISTVNFNSVDTSVIHLGSSLLANATVATFQWIDCTTGNAIVGETGPSFSPLGTGNYAVQVTQNGCTDTSECHMVIVTSSGMDGSDGSLRIRVYPNPVASTLNLEVDTRLIGGSASLYSALGQLQGTVPLNGETTTIDLSDYPPGVYYLTVTDHSGTQAPTIRFVRK